MEAREAWEHRCVEGGSSKAGQHRWPAEQRACYCLAAWDAGLLELHRQSHTCPNWWLPTFQCVFCVSVQVDGDAEENRDVKQQLDVSRADWRGAGCLRVIVQVRLMRWLLVLIKRAGSWC